MDRNENNNTESGIQIDPDYECTNTAIRNIEIKEEEENRLTEDRLATIIQEEFDKELNNRQKQLEEIEEKIFKAQKLLHIVRYVLISSYYNNKALEYESSNYSALETSNMMTGQNRIHPAVKKLLGRNVNNLRFLTARSKRKAAAKSEILIPPESKKIKLDLEEFNQNRAVTAAPIKAESINKDAKAEQEIVTNRKKTQHKLVIGNISYFKKSLEQDNLTHKWMVYVKMFKGSKNGPEVSNVMISKVIFYLHPSYKPHDVVEISHPPYHLSRRGWGEFPLKVQICFKSSLNKPVEVIHQLKLDKTFTERQTLGNETVVPVFLYDETFQGIENNKNSDVGSEFQPVNNNYSNTSGFSTLTTSTSSDLDTEDIKVDIKIEHLANYENYEHNYCYDNDSSMPRVLEIKEETVTDDYNNQTNVIGDETNDSENHNVSLRDHSYSLPYSKEGHSSSSKRQKSPVKQAYNELIYGLGQHYLDSQRSKARSVKPRLLEKSQIACDKNQKALFKVLKTVTGQSIRFLPESFSQALLSNGNVVSVKFLKSPPGTSQKGGGGGGGTQVLNLDNKLASISNIASGSARSTKELISQEKILLKLPKNNFKNMGEALPYLFKRIPLWNMQAKNLEIKAIYPFMADSRKQYESWNIGKKLSSEWSRAKTIKRILSGKPYCQNWTTKAIFMYGRSHLYSPLVSSYKLFDNESPEKQLILNCFTTKNCIQNGCPRLTAEDNDESINITSPTKDRQNCHSTEICMDISDRRLTQECAFVKEAALDVGVVLKPEELSKGVLMNAPERLMYEAVKCFAENLIRRSRNYLISDGDYNANTAVISRNEIERALEERSEFDHIRKFKENKLTMDFFS